MQLTRRDLYDMIWAEPVTTVAERFKMSGNGLAKLCDRLDIPRPPRTHWMRSGDKRGNPPALPAAPDGLSEFVQMNQRANASRKPRTRLNLENRRAQLMDVAAGLILERGLSDLSMKTIARKVGISEAQVHNCFGGRVDLLVALARREVSAISSRRGVRFSRGQNRRTRIVISTISYLHEAAERGPLLQLLLRNPEVKRALRHEQEDTAVRTREPIVRGMVERGGLDRDRAIASTAALTAVSLRAGGMVAARRAPFAVVERLCVAMTMAGIDSDDRFVRARNRVPSEN